MGQLRSKAGRDSTLSHAAARLLSVTAAAWLLLIFWRVPVYLLQGKDWVLSRLASFEASVWAAILGVPLLLAAASWGLFLGARGGALIAAAAFAWWLWFWATDYAVPQGYLMLPLLGLAMSGWLWRRLAESPVSKRDDG